MSAKGQHQQQTQRRQQSQSEAEQRVRKYMLDDESISYSLRFRPTGLLNWLKSVFGFGVTHWFVTNQRLIQEKRIGGGFTFQDVPHGKISSLEYGSKVSLPIVAIGVLVGLLGLGLTAESPGGGLLVLVVGLLLVGYAYWRQQQVLSVKGSGGVKFTLAISKGQQVDECLWYLHAERQKQTE